MAASMRETPDSGQDGQDGAALRAGWGVEDQIRGGTRQMWTATMVTRSKRTAYVCPMSSVDVVKEA